MPAEHMSDRLETVSDASKSKDQPTKDGQKKSKPDLLIVPIPQSSPTLGSGLTLTATMFYNPNQSKEPWITGIGVMATSNKSKVIGALHKMSFDEDRFKLTLFGGYGDVNMRFYGVGSGAGSRDVSIELNERGFAGMIDGQVRLAKNLYAGGRLVHLTLDTSINRDNPRFPELELPTRAFTSKLTKVGPEIVYDSRDNSLTPTKGEYATGLWMFGVGAFGGDFKHNKLTVFGNVYRPLAKGTVIAARASVCSVSEGAPFYDLCFYGASSDLRGYEAGRFRDGAYWATQLELRQKLFGRFGAVAFAGMGESAPDLSIGKGRFLPSAGVGLRYQPSKETPINLRLDWAKGKDSSALYIGIGEAF